MTRALVALVLGACLVGPAIALAQTTPATPPPAQPPAAAPATPAPSTTTPAPAPTRRTSTTGRAATPAKPTGTQLASDQFTTEAAAKGSCSGDTVVWANIRSKVYHMSGTKFYGKTSRGAYMCQKAANSDGYHQSTGG